MTTEYLLSTADWRKFAQRHLERAARAKDPDVRNRHLALAAEYERLGAEMPVGEVSRNSSPVVPSRNR